MNLKKSAASVMILLAEECMRFKAECPRDSYGAECAAYERLLSNSEAYAAQFFEYFKNADNQPYDYDKLLTTALYLKRQITDALDYSRSSYASSGIALFDSSSFVLSGAADTLEKIICAIDNLIYDKTVSEGISPFNCEESM